MTLGKSDHCRIGSCQKRMANPKEGRYMHKDENSEVERQQIAVRNMWKEMRHWYSFGMARSAIRSSWTRTSKDFRWLVRLSTKATSACSDSRFRTSRTRAQARGFRWNWRTGVFVVQSDAQAAIRTKKTVKYDEPNMNSVYRRPKCERNA